MIIADLHNDTAYELFYGKKHLNENDLNIDLKKQSFSKNLLFYAIYMNPEKYGNNKWEYFINIYNYFINELQKNKKEIQLFKSVSDFSEKNMHNAVITLEGGDIIENISDIERLSLLEIKIITLTWNNSNKIASSCMDTFDTGLSSFGVAAIEKMEALGIIPDLSHCSDKTFFDVIKNAKMPVVVSHSNSRALQNEKRNITDEMFLALKEKGGLLGINFYSRFLGNSPSIKDVIKHIEHFLTLDGENHIAFGSDFDGVSELPEGITDFSSYKKIYELLCEYFSKDTAEKIMYKNVLDFLEKHSNKNVIPSITKNAER